VEHSRARRPTLRALHRRGREDMSRLSIAASIIALCAASASAAPGQVPRPAPRTLDRLSRLAVADGHEKADRKVSSRLRAAESQLGPLAGPLVPADPPRSPGREPQGSIDRQTLSPRQPPA